MRTEVNYTEEVEDPVDSDGKNLHFTSAIWRQMELPKYCCQNSDWNTMADCAKGAFTMLEWCPWLLCKLCVIVINEATQFKFSNGSRGKQQFWDKSSRTKENQIGFRLSLFNFNEGCMVGREQKVMRSEPPPGAAVALASPGEWINICSDKLTIFNYIHIHLYLFVCWIFSHVLFYFFHFVQVKF